MDMNYTNKLANNSDSHGHGDIDHDHISMEDPILHHQHHQISYAHHPVWPNFPLHQMPSSSAHPHHPHHHHHQVSRPTITSDDQFGGVHDQLQEVGSTNDNYNFTELEDDHHQDEEEADEEEGDEQLGAMKEMMYKMAAMQPVDIDPATIRKPKRRNVRISDDPQSVAARHRRERISEKIRILQRLVPGGTKMDTASMLDEAIRYLKFLKRQVRLLQSSNHHHHHHHQMLHPQPQLLDWLSPITSVTPNNNNNHHYHASTTTAAASTDTPTTRPAAGFAFGGGSGGDAASSCFGLQS